MIRQTDTSRTNTSRTESARADSSRDSQDRLHQYDHLIPPMKKVLKFTAKATWFMMKTLVKAAFHLPALIRKTTQEPQLQPAQKTNSKKSPSPESAFPAP